MAIATGEKIPDVQLKTMGKREPESVSSFDVLGKGRVVLFGVPGAFTPTCSDHHLPGFLARAEELRRKGVDRIACVAVNDAWVMGAWGQERGVGEEILMLADGSGEFTRAVGLENDLSAGGLGMRSKRFAMVIDDGVVSYLGVETAPGVSVSGAEAVLAAL
jgi:glutaredoxin/glutathione-dependent peroxiredoxin